MKIKSHKLEQHKFKQHKFKQHRFKRHKFKQHLMQTGFTYFSCDTHRHMIIISELGSDSHINPIIIYSYNHNIHTCSQYNRLKSHPSAVFNVLMCI